jgi:hypothetical protein
MNIFKIQYQYQLVCPIDSSKKIAYMYLAGTSKLDTHPTHGKNSNKFGLHVYIINIVVSKLNQGLQVQI